MMITFEKFFYLEEARRNSEQNPKVSIYEFLKPYANDSDVYISFTEDLKSGTTTSGEKLGINPQSKYNTPLGIYTYPLKEVWDFYDVDKKQSLKQLPFATNNPHVWVVKAKNVGTSFIDDMYSDYGSDKYDRDKAILREIWDRESGKIKNFAIPDDAYEDYYYQYDNAVAEYNLHKNNLEKLQKKEPSVLTPENNTHEWVTKKLSDAKRKLDELDKFKTDYIKKHGWDDLVDTALDTAKVKNSVMSFWNLTRLMAQALSGKNAITRTYYTTTKWNSLLRQCGYTGFADKSGKGYIHESEPIQAVFLSRDAFDVIGVWDNKDYKSNKNTIKSIKDMVEYTKQLQDTSIEFLYYLADKHLATKYSTGVVKYITKSPKELIDECDYDTLKEFFMRLISYTRIFIIDNKDEFLTCCKVIRSKYSIANMMYKDTPEWSRINAMINMIEDIISKG